jgi:protein-S-isoprenylcysteine O-methyltransferase Ste14
MNGPGVLALALGDGTPRKAAAAAVVVGSALTLINHGDVLAAGEAPPLWKVALTYCVPYCVATWGAVTAKRALRAAARSGAAPSSS